MIDAAMTDNKAKVFAMCEKLGIAGKIRSEDKEKTGKPLMKSIMQAWLPAHEVRAFPPTNPFHTRFLTPSTSDCLHLHVHVCGFRIGETVQKVRILGCGTAGKRAEER